MRILFLLSFGWFCLHMQCATPKSKSTDSIMNPNYEQWWKEVAAFEANGLPKSASDKVYTIYNQAKTEKNEKELIKTIIHLAKYNAQLDAAGLKAALLFFEKEIGSNQGIGLAILQSLTAQLYHQYFQMNIWQLRNRTPLPGTSGQPEDLDTWSGADFVQRIRELYLKSVSQPALREASVNNYTSLLTEGKSSDTLRPSLYDILAHRALDYFLDTRSDLDLSAEEYTFIDPRLFAHTRQFLEVEKVYDSADPSGYKQTIRLFQSLETFHQNDRLKAAWLDVIQKRLQYMYDHFTGPGKELLYEAALDQWITLYPAQAAPFLLRKAILYQQLGNQYSPFGPDSIYRLYLVKSKEILLQIQSKFPNTTEALEANNQLISLLNHQINAELEQVNVPSKPFRLMIEYRNTPVVYGRVVRITDQMRKEIWQHQQDRILKILSDQTPISEFKQAVPATDDLQSHRAEIKADKLQPGFYALLLSDHSGFKAGEDLIAVVYTHISNLAFLHSFQTYYPANSTQQRKKIFVVDRTLGSPQAGVKATFYEQYYNPSQQAQEWREVLKSVSDQEGALVPQLAGNKNYSIQLEKGDDRLWLQEGFSSSTYSNNQTKEQEAILFFLDRSIYRPGQLVYFKGLAIIQDGHGKPRIIKNRKITLSQKDANGQEIIKKTFVTNEFGSFNGSFQTPVNGLTGTMTLVSDLNQASVSFQVEEYKRPRFEVKLDTHQISKRINETITLSGHALNFAGNAVDQAKVIYTVTRNRWIMPYPWWYGKGFPVRSVPVIITHGETKTDTAGMFSVPFIALPEPNTDLTKEDLSYIYSVSVDITDFTGETRSASTEIRIGTKTLSLSVDLGDEMPNDKFKSVLIRTMDLNGIPVKANGTYTLSQLKQPATPYRIRYWSQPDQFIFSEKDYHQLFPLDIYNNEDQINTWPVDKIIQQGPFEGNQSFPVRNTPEPGIYKLIASSTDRYNQTTEFVHFFRVYDFRLKKFPATTPLVAVQNQAEFEPGGQLSYFIQTPDASQYVLKADSRSAQFSWLTGQPIRSDSINISEADRGKLFHLVWYLVKDNRIYTEKVDYSIPWSNKRLQIQTMSFRDKLLPGQKEEWTLKITGPDKEKFIAEAVASMYDRSLDLYYPHQWNTDLYSLDDQALTGLLAPSFNTVGAFIISYPNQEFSEIPVLIYRDLNWFGFEMGYRNYYARSGVKMKSQNGVNDEAEMAVEKDAYAALQNAEAPPMETSATAALPKATLPPRVNLNETVFFYPQIKTDTAGNVLIKFTMNEALTRWRLMVFGHTADLKSGYFEKDIVTQKELMVFPNGPRFVRQGDVILLPAKVNNMSSEDLKGSVRLELFDPMTGNELNRTFNFTNAVLPVQISKGQSAGLSWKLTIPGDYSGLLGYRVIAEAGSFSDGEENTVPVLTNRMLITESLPVQVRGNSTKSFVFSELLNKSASGTLKNHSFTLEYTSNPVWYAIQALPYIMEYPYECTEQIVNRLFANLLAGQILEANPGIKRVFDAWSKEEQLKSPLQKNEELKNAILAETPWVKDALAETEQQKMIALLFDLNRMESEKSKAFQVLQERQLTNGGFPWFTGRDDWYITQYLVESFGHLKKLGLLGNEYETMVLEAVHYCDRELKKYYDELKKSAGKNEVGLPQIAIQYLYARSFFKDLKISNGAEEAHTYFLGVAEKNWLKQNVYTQGMIALSLHRNDPSKETSKKIIASLNERAQHHEELGMYWKFDHGYHWFELPIETQAVLIEAFDEITTDRAAVEEMKLWLLKNKQTNHWSSSKSTAAAIYALMTRGTSWIVENAAPEIVLGKETIKPASGQTMAGTGYFKMTKPAHEVNASLANIKITNPNKNVLWGSAYWQYFEDLDKISSSNTLPLQMNKKILVEKVENNKRVLKPIDDLNIGDKLVVRIELRVDRPLEYVHLKDMRAAGLEPLNVISENKYQDGLSYYESTKDLATHFFFDHLSPGTYVFEYPLRVSQAGVFSNGVSTIQCMYAPEFTAHSKGEIIRIN